MAQSIAANGCRIYRVDAVPLFWGVARNAMVRSGDMVEPGRTQFATRHMAGAQAVGNRTRRPKEYSKQNAQRYGSFDSQSETGG